MNPIIIGACCTALATVIAACIAAAASVRSSRHARQMNAAVATPDGVPDIGRLVTSLFDETLRQGKELDRLGDKLEEHLVWHDHDDFGEGL